MKQIKIGVLGENPRNDADAFTVLLKKKYNVNITYKTILRNISGDMLNNPQILYGNLLNELKNETFDYIICIRDLDDLRSNTDAISKRASWFNNLNSKIDHKGIFFLAIYEMEALILADIDTFNRYYNLNVSLDKDPIEVVEPKEFLKKLTGYKYKTSHCSKIFEVADFEKIYQNHQGDYSFQEFIIHLNDKLSLAS
jgi:Domain of unknown function (DUF4276)